MTTRYDAVISRKDKDGKWRSTKIGSAFPKEDRFNIVLDALPMPNAEGQAWITLFPSKPKDEQSKGPDRASSGNRHADLDDEVPF
jgi:hypothetical protein